MIGKLIVSHGPLAGELLAAARAIVGVTPAFRALCLDWSEGCDEAERRIAEVVKEVDQGQGVLILADMYGATPCNAALNLPAGQVEVLGGVNLPMIVRLASAASEPASVGELAQWILRKGKDSIRAAGQSGRLPSRPLTP